MTILNERYELIELLAEGGENIVYFTKTTHTRTGCHQTDQMEYQKKQTHGK